MAESLKNIISVSRFYQATCKTPKIQQPVLTQSFFYIAKLFVDHNDSWMNFTKNTKMLQSLYKCVV